MQTFFNTWYVRTLILAILAGVVFALAAYTYLTFKEARFSQIGPPTVSVRGEGEVLAAPDIGRFTFAVLAEEETATAAQTASADALNSAIAYLEAQGVAREDIKTIDYRLTPQYRTEREACPAGQFCPPTGDRVLDGYEAQQTVEVKVRDLTAAGELITGIGEQGATNISNLQFTIDDPEQLQAEARAAAIADAKAKAAALADALDVDLVRLVGFYEEGDSRRFGFQGYGAGAPEAAMARTSPDMPVGENQVMSTVNLTFEIR